MHDIIASHRRDASLLLSPNESTALCAAVGRYLLDEEEVRHLIIYQAPALGNCGHGNVTMTST